MAAIVASQSIPYETRINLAVQAIQASQVPSIRAAATLYDVSRATLQRRLLGRGARRAAQANNRKWTATEEQALLDRIISLDERGFSPTLPFVRRMADLLQSQRVPGSSVGKNWLTRFVQRHDALVSKYLRKYDYQRAKCEDPEEINKWFSLVRATIAKYGIAAEDIYNFDETGFQMGVIATAKVITQTKQPTKDNPKSVRTNSGRPKVIQPGNRTWVTVIEGVNATGWALPSTIIFEGKVHQSNWYQTGIPPNWVIGVSENGWTNNDLGFKWLTEVFDKHSRGRLVGRYRLLLLDGHGSHLTPEFDDFCKKSSIIWLCYPPHSTHLLQPLDFGCFSALKGSYGRLVQDKVGLGTFHIDKTDFLNLYYQAHRMKFTEKTIKNAFEAVGIVPYDPQKVLSRLNVRTPSPLLQQSTLGPQGLESRLLPQTPHKIIELEAQVKYLQEHRTKASHEQASPTDQAVRYLVKGCQMAMHNAALLSEENERLRRENQRQKRKRDMRRSYVAHGGVLAVEQGVRLAEKANGSRGQGYNSARPRKPAHNGFAVAANCPGIIFDHAQELKFPLM